MKNGGIYEIRCKASMKSYIGNAVDFKIRFKNHKASLRGGTHHSIKLQRAWIKYGEDSFEFLVIERITERSSLLQREQHWLDELNSVDDGYNICRSATSPMLGRKFSEEHRRKMSESAKGRAITPEAREKMRQAALNRSPEIAKKIADSRPKRVHTEDSRRRVSELSKGRLHSEESKAKIGEASRGRKHSEETKAKVAATKARNKMLREFGMLKSGESDGESAYDVGFTH